MRDILVTGTDTGIGKTVIAAALVKVLRRRGVRALGFKPAETGLDEETASDSEWLQRASGDIATSATPVLRLDEALAPAVAADRAGVVVRTDEIEERIAALRQDGYTLIIEGAGGVMVPLAWCGRRLHGGAGFYTVLDLAERCGLDSVVVARAGLGTLNHVALTVAMLRSRRIPIAGIVLNGADSSSRTNLAEATNPATLARMLPDVRIISVPHHASGDVIDATMPYLIELLPDPQAPDFHS